jgi:hypothetical protein
MPSSPTSTDMTLYVSLRGVAPSEQVFEPPKEGPYHPRLPYSIHKGPVRREWDLGNRSALLRRAGDGLGTAQG